MKVEWILPLGWADVTTRPSVVAVKTAGCPRRSAVQVYTLVTGVGLVSLHSGSVDLFCLAVDLILFLPGREMEDMVLTYETGTGNVADILVLVLRGVGGVVDLRTLSQYHGNVKDSPSKAVIVFGQTSTCTMVVPDLTVVLLV